MHSARPAQATHCFRQNLSFPGLDINPVETRTQPLCFLLWMFSLKTLPTLACSTIYRTSSYNTGQMSSLSLLVLRGPYCCRHSVPLSIQTLWNFLACIGLIALFTSFLSSKFRLFFVFAYIYRNICVCVVRCGLCFCLFCVWIVTEPPFV